MRFRTLYPLWRITGEEKYFDQFADAFSPTEIPIPYLAAGGERERKYLIEMLENEDSGGVIEAAMALHLRFNDHDSIKKILIKYFGDVRGASWRDGILARRLVGSINDSELNQVARDYEIRNQTGFHDRFVVYRQNWRYPEWEDPLFMD